ncbi:diguanylate cyclase [Polymorphobacter sp. PAMC 29334]|uniref:diguanylate cyclase n=1 Tax=Polymorphobacter sp. PAMC 29334 TaxID=2862331 RepID=UPI001C775BDF|nr:diguanylate cyclase [Polymorphobacter sp. PAMC 29334]QYE36393.1 diguanylate cyclase [Polymorphobacter sp. PAMC 29334]
MRGLSNRQLTISYVTALSIIALLSIASHLLLERMLAAHAGSAAVVNMSGRQRMLSQRIAGLAAQYRLGVPDAKTDLVAAVDEFEVNHHALIVGDAARHVPAADTPALQKIYFGGQYPLDPMVKAYLAHARRVLTMTQEDPALPAEISALAAAARIRLIDGLNAVVTEHVHESERQLANLELLQNLLLIVVLLTLFFEALGIFRPMVTRMTRYSNELFQLASTDPLTGALNRRSFDERAGAELARAYRYKEPVSMLMIDADNFKRVNDTYGHSGGDQVLVALAAYLKNAARRNDLVSRFGGEEFGILLPVTDISAALILAERIRSGVEDLRVPFNGSEIAFTISVGAAEVDAAATCLQLTRDRADQALYAAKMSGRNRVSAAAQPEFELQ